MSRATLRLRHLAALVGALAAPAAARGPWLLPSATTVGMVGQGVTIDAAASDAVFSPEHPTALETITITAPDGMPGQPQNGMTGRYRSTFDLVLDKPGTWKIASEQTGIMGSFKLNGEDWRVGRRGPPPAAGRAQTSPQPAPQSSPQSTSQPAPRPASAAGSATAAPPGGPVRRIVATPGDIPAGATDIKLVEMVSRNAVFVTAAVPTGTVLKPSGKGLEADFVTHPDDLVANEDARIRFLIDGRPASGVKIAVVASGRRYRDADDPIALVTGADGSARIHWPAPGMYWLSATASDAHPSDPAAQERRMTTSITLEVAAP